MVDCAFFAQCENALLKCEQHLSQQLIEYYILTTSKNTNDAILHLFIRAVFVVTCFAPSSVF